MKESKEIGPIKRKYQVFNYQNIPDYVSSTIKNYKRDKLFDNRSIVVSET